MHPCRTFPAPTSTATIAAPTTPTPPDRRPDPAHHDAAKSGRPSYSLV